MRFNEIGVRLQLVGTVGALAILAILTNWKLDSTIQTLYLGL